MARYPRFGGEIDRPLKPEFFCDPDIAEMSPAARWAYLGLFCNVNSAGEFNGSIRQLKARVIPYDDTDLRPLLEEMERYGFISLQGSGDFIRVKLIRPSRYTGIRPSEAEWKRLRKQVFERDNYTCQYCGTTEGRMTCDHITPVAQDGANTLENLVTACRPCNTAKNNRTPGQWAAVSK